MREMAEGICEFGIQKFHAVCILSNQSYELVQCTYWLLLAVVQNVSMPYVLGSVHMIWHDTTRQKAACIHIYRQLTERQNILFCQSQTILPLSSAVGDGLL
jgi:hypothetical protein